jgi:hypothetical protein
MRFLADECLQVAIVAALRDAGHEVATLQGTDAGASDRVVLQRALKNRAILLTADKDFGRIVIAQGAGSSSRKDRRLLASSCTDDRRGTPIVRPPVCSRRSTTTASVCTSYMS